MSVTVDDQGTPVVPVPTTAAAPAVDSELGETPEAQVSRAPKAIAAMLLRAARTVGWALLGAAVTVAIWHLVATQSDGVPTPAEASKTFVTLLSDPFYDNGPNDKGIGTQLIISLQRVFVGWSAASVVGIVAGLWIGTSKRAWAAFNPIVQLLRPVSPLAWFPIWLVILSDAALAAVFVIFITALWPTLINTAAGAAHIPHDQRSVARVFKFGRFAYVRHVLIPNALPSMITGLRLSMGIAWMVIVAVEMLSGNSGVGFLVWDSYNTGSINTVITAIVLIGLIGFMLDSILLRISRWVAIGEVQS